MLLGRLVAVPDPDISAGYVDGDGEDGEREEDAGDHGSPPSKFARSVSRLNFSSAAT